MNSVTFPTDLGGDGSTITDDDNPSTGLDGGGHRARLVPTLSQTVQMARTAKEMADAAAGAVAAVREARDEAGEHADRANQSRQETASLVSAASGYAASAGNQAGSAASSAASANGALLALGNVLANGIGMFSVNPNGELVGEYNTPTVTALAIDAGGNLVVTY